MTSKHHNAGDYNGFEQGPIRPPSEAHSLLIRITRNCPWNHCTFCPVYKGARFSLRPPDHVIRDIDQVAHVIEQMLRRADGTGSIAHSAIREIADEATGCDPRAFRAAVHWVSNGMRSIFLQDANSLIVKPQYLIRILRHLKSRFPWVERITSYARSHTIARISDNDLEAMRGAGLNRIHIGMESGSDRVLEMARKGVDKATHIRAGVKVKRAGMELSEYVMPGLGGVRLSREHALETADALNRIDPDFIRLRTLAIPGGIPLYDDYMSGEFEKCTDRMMAEEILLFLEALDGVASMIKSDHVLNLFQELEGRYPEDKPCMTGIIRAFLARPPAEQTVYQIGRRLGIFSRLEDLDDPRLKQKAEETCARLGVTPENADHVIDEVMRRFI